MSSVSSGELNKGARQRPSSNTLADKGAAARRGSSRNGALQWTGTKSYLDERRFG